MTNPSAPPGEFDLISRYFAPLSRSLIGAANLTDDTASLPIGAGHEVVVTMDTMVAGVHFLADDPPDLIARKLLRVNLSDLASAGARPVTYLLALSLPDGTAENWVAGFAKGLAEDQKIFDIALSGGDTTVTPGPLTLSLTAIGEVLVGKTIRRSTARPGQDIYVSGAIGDAALALFLIENGGVQKALAQAPDLLARYRCPEPRTQLGIELRDLATAMIDVSDGLVADLGHICEASTIGAEIMFAQIPLSRPVERMIAGDPSLAERAITGGDDYELLFTARPGDAAALGELAIRLDLPLTRIGRTLAGTEPIVLSASGEAMSLDRAGWQHF
ncbi:MAG: thiamine-phosphate kinase [Rhodospirillaceae bacterium]|nr:thiamine-phosphate kinase [Rhodospirillaceae bacterium]